MTANPSACSSARARCSARRPLCDVFIRRDTAGARPAGRGRAALLRVGRDVVAKRARDSSGDSDADSSVSAPTRGRTRHRCPQKRLVTLLGGARAMGYGSAWVASLRPFCASVAREFDGGRAQPFRARHSDKRTSRPDGHGNRHAIRQLAHVDEDLAAARRAVARNKPERIVRIPSCDEARFTLFRARAKYRSRLFAHVLFLPGYFFSAFAVVCRGKVSSAFGILASLISRSRTSSPIPTTTQFFFT